MKKIKTFESFFGLKKSNNVEFHEDGKFALELMDTMLSNPSGLTYENHDIENPVIYYRSGDNSIRLHVATSLDNYDHVGLLDRDIYTFNVNIDGKGDIYNFKSNRDIKRKYSKLLLLSFRGNF